MAAEANNPQIKNNPTLPSFNTDNPSLWLNLIEMAFNAYGVTDDSQRCYLTIAALPYTIQQEISDIIVPNSPISYDDLRTTIIKKTQIPAQKRMRKLLHDTPIGDKTPTQYLRHLRDLAGPDTDRNSPVIRSIFLNGIPNKVTMIVAPKADQPLDDIADIAERVFVHMDNSSMVISSPSLNALSLNPCANVFTPVPNQATTDLATLTATVNSLQLGERSTAASYQSALTNIQQQITALSSDFNTTATSLQRQITNLREETQHSRFTNYRQSREQSRDNTQRGNSRNNSSDRSSNGLCYYHHKYQEQARKCTQPCSWNGPPINNQGN